MSLLVKVVRRLGLRTDDQSGMILELRIGDRLPSYLDLGLWLRRARLTDVSALIDRVEPALPLAELEDVTRADLIADPGRLRPRKITARLRCGASPR